MPKVKDDEPMWLPIGTAVSARYHGAYCEAYVKSVKKTLRCRIRIVKPKDQQNNVLLFTDDAVQTGVIGISNTVSVKDATGKILEGRILAVEDQSEYQVRFNDGDEKTLRRSAITPRSGKHFGSASEPNIAAVLAAAVASAAGAAPPPSTSSKTITKVKSDGGALHAPATPETKKLLKKKSSDVDTPSATTKTTTSADALKREPASSAPTSSAASPMRRSNKSTPSSRPTLPLSSNDATKDRLVAKEHAIESAKLSTSSRGGEKRTPSKAARDLEKTIKKSKSFQIEDISDDADEAESSATSKNAAVKVKKAVVSDSESPGGGESSPKRKKIHRENDKRSKAARRLPASSRQGSKPRNKPTDSAKNAVDDEKTAESSSASDTEDQNSLSHDAEKQQKQRKKLKRSSSSSLRKTADASVRSSSTPRRTNQQKLPGRRRGRPSAAAVGLQKSTPSAAKKRRLSKAAADSDAEKKKLDESSPEKSSSYSRETPSEDDDDQTASASPVVGRKRPSTNTKAAASSPGTPKSPPVLVSAVGGGGGNGSITPISSSKSNKPIDADLMHADVADADHAGQEESPSPSNVPPPPPLLHADGSLFSPTTSDPSFTSSIQAQHHAAESIAPPMLRLLDDTSNYEIGKLVIIEVQTRKQSLPYIPAIVVHPMATKRIRTIDPSKEYIVRSLADNSFLKFAKNQTEPLLDMEALEALIPSTTSDSKVRQLYNITKSYMRDGILPSQWNEKVLFEGAAAADHDAESVLSSSTTTPRMQAGGKQRKAATKTAADVGRPKDESTTAKRPRGRRPRHQQKHRRQRRRTLSNGSGTSSSAKTDTTTHSSSTTVKPDGNDVAPTRKSDAEVKTENPQSPPPVLLSTNSVTSNVLPEVEHATPPDAVESDKLSSKSLSRTVAAVEDERYAMRASTPADEPPVAILAAAAAAAAAGLKTAQPSLSSSSTIAELPTLPAAALTPAYPPMRYSPISPAKLPSSRASPPPSLHVAEKKPLLTDVASPPSNSVGERLGFRDETASAMPTLDDLPTLPAAAVTAVSVPPSTATTTTSRATLLRGRALSTVSAAGSNHSSTQEAASTMLSPRKRAYRDAMRTEQFQSQRKHVDFDALKPGAEIKLLYQNPKTQHIDAYTARVTDTYNDTDDSAVTAAERRGRLVFVHYHGWNQRFDEWVDASRILHIVSITDAGSAAYVPTTSYHNRAMARLTSKKFTSSSARGGNRQRLASGSGSLSSKQHSLVRDAVANAGSPASAAAAAKAREFDSESISSSSITSDPIANGGGVQKKAAVVAIDLDIGNSVHVDDSDAAGTTPTTSPRKVGGQHAFFGGSVLSPLAQRRSSAAEDDAGAATPTFLPIDVVETPTAAATNVADVDNILYSKATSPSSMSVVSSIDEQTVQLSSSRFATAAAASSATTSSSSTTSRLIDAASGSSKSSSRPHSSSLQQRATTAQTAAAVFGTSSLSSLTNTATDDAEKAVHTPQQQQQVASHHLPLYSSTLSFSVPNEPPVSGNVMLRDTQASSDELRTRNAKRLQRFSRLSLENSSSSSTGGFHQTAQQAAATSAAVPLIGKRTKHADLSSLRTPKERARLKSTLSSAYNVLTHQLEHDVPISPFPPASAEHTSLRADLQQSEQILAECYRDAASSLNVVHNPLFVPPSQRVLLFNQNARERRNVGQTAATSESSPVNWRHVKRLQATLSNDCSVKTNEYCVPLVNYAAQYYDALGRLKLPLDGSRKTGYLATSSMLAANFKADEGRQRVLTKDHGSNRAVVVEGVELIIPPTNLPDNERLKLLENLQQKLRLMYQIKQRRVVKMLKIREEIRLKEIKSMRKDFSSTDDASESGGGGDDESKLTKTATESAISPQPSVLAGN